MAEDQSTGISPYSSFAPAENNLFYGSAGKGAKYMSIGQIFGTDSPPQPQPQPQQPIEQPRLPQQPQRRPLTRPKTTNVLNRDNRTRQSSPDMGNICPFCGAPVVTKCTCTMCESLCARGHRYYIHPRTGRPVILEMPPPMPTETRETNVTKL
jgi:hypothetical protein